ncbi:MAG: isoprenyl transferase [Tannerella sp.]|jgi:undecaprenyl diphosphate synthase|nr:isoprenyl transferase [Tannerella sp.]
MSLKENIDLQRLPHHVAIIMDGNGRWAQAHGQDRSQGHQEGVAAVRRTLKGATAIGLEYVTVYTFSNENWNRPEEEVIALMELLVTAIRRETAELMEKNVRLLAIGNLERLPRKAYDCLQDCIRQTAGNTGTSLVLALSYSSRWELARAARLMAEDALRGKLAPADITERRLCDYLTTSGIPDPDLLVRTGGEKRISNFLLWQLSYTELYFTETFWPDFGEEKLYEAILHYQQRERRFGKTSEQITHKNQ